jgi:hypothetical protein
MITPKIALIFIILALGVGLGFYTVYPTPQKYSTEPKACTLEAKLCPGGSSVGRNPNKDCQFDACPTYPPPGSIMEDGTGDSSTTTNATTTKPEQVFCTADAKLCPDGSYVGRSGPKCEFAPCPQ